MIDLLIVLCLLIGCLACALMLVRFVTKQTVLFAQNKIDQAKSNITASCTGFDAVSPSGEEQLKRDIDARVTELFQTKATEMERNPRNCHITMTLHNGFERKEVRIVSAGAIQAVDDVIDSLIVPALLAQGYQRESIASSFSDWSECYGENWKEKHNEKL